MTRRRRRLSPATLSPLENEDILSEILLRLAPAPSSLPRASLVCKRWRRLVSDPAFLRRFRARHRHNAPLLGFFTEGSRDPSFSPTLEPPDRLPRGRFTLELDDGCLILGCRHGLALILNRARHQVLVWDPVTGDTSRVAFPPVFGDGGSAAVAHGAVLRVARDGDDRSIPFLVALVGIDIIGARVLACVYSSVTGLWGDIISTACPTLSLLPNSSTLVGDSLYWMLGLGFPVGILEFDIDRQCLAVIDVPPDTETSSFCRHWVVPAEGGSLAFLGLSGYSAQLWMRKKGCDGVARWVPGRTIELDKLLSLNTEAGFPPLIFGFYEEDNVSFLVTSDGVFMVQLEQMQFKKPFELSNVGIYYPFASVYTTGMGIDGGHDGPELLHDA